MTPDEIIKVICASGKEFEDALGAYGCAYGDLAEVFANVSQDLEEEWPTTPGRDDGGFEIANCELSEEYAKFDTSYWRFLLKLVWPFRREIGEKPPSSEEEIRAAQAQAEQIVKRARKLVKRTKVIYELATITAELADPLLAAWEQEQGVVSLFAFDRQRLAKLVETLGVKQQEVVRSTPLRGIKFD